MCVLYTSPFRRTASIVGNGCDVFDQVDFQPRGLKGSQCGFPSCPRTFHINIDGSHAVFHCFLSCILRSHLGCKGSALSGPFEALGAGTGPGDHISFWVGDRDNGVIKRCLNMSNPCLDVLFYFLLLCPWTCCHISSMIRNILVKRCVRLLFFLLPSNDGSAGSFPCPRIGMRPLAVNGQ